MNDTNDILTQIQKQWEDDRRNTETLRRANKVVELITPIMENIPLTEEHLGQVYKIVRDNGFSDWRDVFAARAVLRSL